MFQCLHYHTLELSCMEGHSLKKNDLFSSYAFTYDSINLLPVIGNDLLCLFFFIPFFCDMGMNLSKEN